MHEARHQESDTFIVSPTTFHTKESSAVPVIEENKESDLDSDDADLEVLIPSKFTRRVLVCAETFNPDEEEEDNDPRVVHPKTDEQRCSRYNLDREQLTYVLDAMFEKVVKKDKHVIDQGDDGDNFYVIEGGTYDMLVTKDNQTRSVGQYDNHGSFGELALRAANIDSTSDGSLWGSDPVTFRRITVKNNAKKRKMFESFIESVPLFKLLEISERMKIVDVIGKRSVMTESQ